MSEHEHYVNICSPCGKIVSQCRCLSLEKTKYGAVCDECKNKKTNDQIINTERTSLQFNTRQTLQIKGKIEMKLEAVNLKELSSSRAPDEWRELKEVKEHYPKVRNREISLQRLDGTDICVWMTGWGGIWHYESDFFMVKPTEGRENED